MLTNELNQGQNSNHGEEQRTEIDPAETMSYLHSEIRKNGLPTEAELRDIDAAILEEDQARRDEIASIEFAPITGEILLSAITSEDFAERIARLRGQRYGDRVGNLLAAIQGEEIDYAIERGFQVYTTSDAQSFFISEIYTGDNTSLSLDSVTLDLVPNTPKGDYYSLIALHHEPVPLRKIVFPSMVGGDLPSLADERRGLIREWGIDCHPIMIILRADNRGGSLLFIQEQAEPHTDDEIQEIEDDFWALTASGDYSGNADFHKILEQSGYNVLFVPDLRNFRSTISEDDLDRFAFTPRKIKVEKELY